MPSSGGTEESESLSSSKAGNLMGDGALNGRLSLEERRFFLLDVDTAGCLDDKGVDSTCLRLRPLPAVKDDFRDLKAKLVAPRTD